ncbi:MAG TPA: GatB/YqeY domain-containing protein [Candidatus Omnitrophota bacterium]|nr:GatB/YqeY domain-containing protein [Candidatus Omnitrophota bacterium]HPT07483.1 GatB/YqeY domain-containing protein [Candidatus Omnitrophota bacterium]
MFEEKIMQDYKEAMKARDSVRSTVLNFLRAEFKNVAIAKKKDVLDDDEAAAIIKKQIKQRQDSIDQFEKGGRNDLAEKEVKEMVILKAYLPAELPVEEIKKILEEVVVVTGALSMKDMGKVMKEANAKIAGKADGKLVSDLVRQRLTAGKF